MLSALFGIMAAGLILILLSLAVLGGIVALVGLINRLIFGCVWSILMSVISVFTIPRRLIPRNSKRRR